MSPPARVGRNSSSLPVASFFLPARSAGSEHRQSTPHSVRHSRKCPAGIDPNAVPPMKKAGPKAGFPIVAPRAWRAKPGDDQSTVAPEALTTFAHLAASLFMNAASCSGFSGLGSAP